MGSASPRQVIFSIFGPISWVPKYEKYEKFQKKN